MTPTFFIFSGPEKKSSVKCSLVALRDQKKVFAGCNYHSHRYHRRYDSRNVSALSTTVSVWWAPMLMPMGGVVTHDTTTRVSSVAALFPFPFVSAARRPRKSRGKWELRISTAAKLFFLLHATTKLHPRGTIPLDQRPPLGRALPKAPAAVVGGGKVGQISISRLLSLSISDRRFVSK